MSKWFSGVVMVLGGLFFIYKFMILIYLENYKWSFFFLLLYSFNGIVHIYIVILFSFLKKAIHNEYPPPK